MTDQIAKQEQALEASSPKRGRGRPKGSKNKNTDIVKTNFGVVVKNMSSKQRKVLDQLVFSATSDPSSGYIPNSVFQGSLSNSPRQLPQNDIKNDHILIKGVQLLKNMSNGSWEIASIETNRGKFTTGEDQTKKINQALVRAFVTYLREQVFEEDLKAFLQQEKL